MSEDYLCIASLLKRMVVYELIVDNIKKKIDGSMSSCFCYVDRAKLAIIQLCFFLTEYQMTDINWWRSSSNFISQYINIPQVFEMVSKIKNAQHFMLFSKSKHKQFMFKKVKGIFIINWLVDVWLEDSKKKNILTRKIKINHKDSLWLYSWNCFSFDWKW